VKKTRRLAPFFLAALLSTSAVSAFAGSATSGLVSPSDEARPMVRWWWFGSAVEPKGLAREIAAMKAGGFGGFEIQPVYALSLDNPETGLKNLEYLSPEFLKAVSFANDEGHRQGMRVDVTMGSGWPYGGPHIGIDEASAQIRLARIPLPSGATDAALPDVGAGEKLIAVFVADGVDQAVAGNSAKAVAFDAKKPRVSVTPAGADRTILAFVQSRTGQQLKRPGPGGEGFVLDHMNEAAVRDHLAKVGEPLMKAFGDKPPYAIFSDSLEVYGADWTPDLLAEFQKRRGYDLTPRLPALYFDGPEADAIRNDWGKTLSELTDERYLNPIAAWAKQHNTRFRSQTYGLPPVSLSSNALVDLAEGEGANWRAFTSTRWASSANHIYGKPVTSAESWTWLHSPAFRATPIDIKHEGDLLLLQGVNQFIAHGWPYTPASEPEPGWAFYAAAVFNDHNPWYPVMPDVTRYFQRMSDLLRRGEPVSDVAILIPTEDAFAGVRPGQATVNGQMQRYITPGLAAQVLDAGYSFDFVDDASIAKLGLKQKVLILPRVNRISPEAYQRIADYVAKGGKVIAVDRLPETAPGLAGASEKTAQVRAIGAKLFAQGSASATQVAEAGVGAALKAATAPDLVGGTPALGFVHRKLSDGDLYFVANTSSASVETKLSFRDQNRKAQWWDAVTGKAYAWTPGSTVSLAPYESRVFVFGAAADAPTTAPVKGKAGAGPVDLSAGWTVAFKDGTSKPVSLPFRWDQDVATRFYSGEAAFKKTVTVTAAQIAAGQTWLDFGEAKATAAAPGRQAARPVAMVDAPIRDAAEVFVNGKRVGALWTPPYRLDLAGALKAGENTVEVRVTNTAINGLAGRAAPDYRLLNLRYTERFTPQDTANPQPLPSGIFGTVALTNGR
jgi:hypothetical protein